MSLAPLLPEQKVKPRRFEGRVGLLFAASLLGNGMQLPYFPVWLQDRGFQPDQIATILAAPILMRVVTTPAIAAAADAARDRANVFVALAWLSFIVSLGYFLPVSYAGVLLVSLALTLVWTPQTPVLDSLAVSGVRRFGSSYAEMRIWGSVTFLLANVVGGYVLAWYGSWSVPAVISLSLLSAGLAGLFAPRIGRPRRPARLSLAAFREAAPQLLNRRFLLFVTGAGVVIGSHGMLYGFGSIYWREIGLSDGVIGLLWAWSVLCEVGLFLAVRLSGRSLNVVPVLVISGSGAVLRWLAFPWIDPLGLGVAGFFVVQTLHVLSTALVLLALPKLMADMIPEERQGAAQGIAYFTNNMAMALTTLASGPLYARFGVDGFYAMGAVALLGLGLILIARRRPA